MGDRCCGRSGISEKIERGGVEEHVGEEAEGEISCKAREMYGGKGAVELEGRYLHRPMSDNFSKYPRKFTVARSSG